MATRQASARVFTWEVTAAGWSRDKYSLWLQAQLRPEFPSVTSGEHGLRFRKTLSGDAYYLVVHESESPAAGSISFTFTSRPF